MQCWHWHCHFMALFISCVCVFFPLVLFRFICSTVFLLVLNRRTYSRNLRSQAWLHNSRTRLQSFEEGTTSTTFAGLRTRMRAPSEGRRLRFLPLLLLRWSSLSGTRFRDHAMDQRPLPALPRSLVTLVDINLHEEGNTNVPFPLSSFSSSIFLPPFVRSFAYKPNHCP